ELGIAWTEGAGERLIELINLPSLNIRGFLSSSVGATARNVIPSTAIASIDIRLVKGVDHVKAVDRVIEHIRAQGYHVVESEPDEATRLKYPKIARVIRQGGYNASRTSMDLPISMAIVAAVESARGAVIKMPTLGGSVPLYIFTDNLKTPCVGIPIANHDNNQHSANENILLQNLWDGIETMAALMTMKKQDAARRPPRRPESLSQPNPRIARGTEFFAPLYPFARRKRDHGRKQICRIQT